MVLYERHPFVRDGKGHIISIVLKEIGDTWRPLICKHLYNKSDELTNCFVSNELITPELEKVIDDISKRIPNFYAGRYDVRFSNLEDFKKGKNFKILELNGVTGYDGEYIVKPYTKFPRWFVLRIMIGLQNIILLNGHHILDMPMVFINTCKRYIKCNDYEQLWSPSSL